MLDIEFNSTQQKLVIKHPRTHKLLINLPKHPFTILNIPQEESLKLRELFESLIPRHIVTRQFESEQILLWDNKYLQLQTQNVIVQNLYDMLDKDIYYPRPTISCIGLSKPTYISTDEVNDEDINFSLAVAFSHRNELPDRIIRYFKSSYYEKNDGGGQTLSRYEHSLQSATLAYRDGRDYKYVVCALLHDLGSDLAFENHSELAAAILKPFVSPGYHWMVLHHNYFQGEHYFEKLGADQNIKLNFKDNPYYELTDEFVRKYDTPAFNPNGEILPLEFFEPMIRKVFRLKAWYKNNLKKRFPMDFFVKSL